MSERIVVTRLRFFGDVILTLPMIEHIRERRPDARIEYVVSSAFAELLRDVPGVARVHALPAGAGLRETLSLASELRARASTDSTC